ncbi:MAG: hypothetical protein K2G24_06015 [Muribaculaceae bacterium]|nr:hypothetical protein [Muribaculaceae bacterium]
MKRQLAVLFLSLAVAISAAAQTGLHVASLFTALRGNANASVTCVQGRALKDYRLSLFHSLTVENDAGLSRMVEEALAKDARKAIDREVHYKDGRLHYAFYNLGRNSDNLNRYILFSGGKRTVLIYLEGKAGPEVINSFFK